MDHVPRIGLELAFSVKAVLIDVVRMFSNVLRVEELLPVKLVDSGLKDPAFLHLVMETSKLDPVWCDRVDVVNLERLNE